MLYAILCYASEDVVCAWSKEQDDAVRADIAAVQEKYARAGKLGPVARLLPTTTATTLRKVRGEAVVTDGPFAETKEQFLNYYTVDCSDLDEAVAFARELSEVNPSGGSYEIRPVSIINTRAL
ncbi:YciI family protein [Manganibacter manganicus]|uniref:YCII-related domain-containing protein n=1 Tax=Manganibacter manganicus TaxID=1873176 RepID=A0A1V8RQR7_9HYPH|nr:YciI family protein [Pseudaminobacter manganicus]OQM75550.1 hypothetical protein BFN67_17340 [Pseudaminobacter manganicus]